MLGSSDVVLEITRVLVSRTKKMKVLVLNIWSWSRSWRKSLAVFQDFCCNSWRQWARHTPWHFVREQKQFAIRKPFFEGTCIPCTSASVERVFNNEDYLLGHTDASEVQCIACGKLFALGSNKPGKQTVHGFKCHLEKCHKDIIHCTWGNSRQQGSTTRKKGETGRGIGGAL